MPISDSQCRESFDEIFEILEEVEKSDDLYSEYFIVLLGTLEQAKQAISYNMKLGIGGVVTFKNGKIDQFLNQIDIKTYCLRNRFAISWHLNHYRGKRNESAYIIKGH